MDILKQIIYIRPNYSIALTRYLLAAVDLFAYEKGWELEPINTNHVKNKIKIKIKVSLVDIIAGESVYLICMF